MSRERDLVTAAENAIRAAGGVVFPAEALVPCPVFAVYRVNDRSFNSVEEALAYLDT